MLKHLSVMQELHPKLSKSDYKKKLSEMLKNGYQQVGIFYDKKCVGIAGFWINTRLYCGKYIDVDNVVVRSEFRSKGMGKKLMMWLEEYGIRNGCENAVLDAYSENAKAHRFYFHEGYSIRGFHFIKKLY